MRGATHPTQDQFDLLSHVVRDVARARRLSADDAQDFAPWAETYTDEKLAWVATPAKRSFPRWPEIADYQGMMNDFRAERGFG